MVKLDMQPNNLIFLVSLMINFIFVGYLSGSSLFVILLLFYVLPIYCVCIRGNLPVSLDVGTANIDTCILELTGVNLNRRYIISNYVFYLP